MINEIFVDVKGYEGLYQISNYGRVKSLTKGSKLLSISVNSNGYPRVCLCANGIKKTKSVHLLVWDHFGNKKRNKRKLQVDHLDDNKLNNHISNLQLLTSRQNVSKHFKSKNKKKPVGIRKAKSGKFVARIFVGNKSLHLGTFKTDTEAHKAYLKKIEEIK